MKNRILGALLLLLALALPARADVQINGINIQPQGNTASIQITIINPAVKTQKGPITMRVWVRANSNAQWTLVKTWSDIGSIGNGEKKSRTYFDDGSALMARLVASNKFDVKVKVTGPGAMYPAEMRQTWQGQ